MKYICFLSALLFASPALHAQHLQLTDTRFYCNGHKETFGDIYDVIQTRDGGFAFVGNTIDTGGGILPHCSTAFRHGVMGRLDSNGNILWINSMCNAGIFPKTICETPDGGFAVNGGAPSTYPWGMLIFRYDKDGNLLWEKNYGRNARAGTAQITVTPDHGFLMLGYGKGIDTDILVNYQWPPVAFQPSDWVLIKLDSFGNKQWVKTLGTSGDEGYSARELICDGRNYYLIGEAMSKDHDCVDTVRFPGPAYSLYTIKLDSAGTVLWSRANTLMQINRVIFDERDNSIVIAGKCGCKASLFGGGFGYDDMMLMKLDTAANLKWGRLYGTADIDEALGLCKGPNNGYLSVGYGYDNSAVRWGAIVSVDNTGKLLEQKIVTGSDFGGIIYNNIFPSKGGYAALGITATYKFNEGTGLNCTYSSIGSGALMLSRFQLWKTGVTVINKPVTAFTLAPNPASNSFQIRWSKAHGAGLITCTGSAGQTILRQKVDAGVSSLDISSASWPKGSYVVCWQAKNESAICQTITIN